MSKTSIVYSRRYIHIEANNSISFFSSFPLWWRMVSMTKKISSPVSTYIQMLTSTIVPAASPVTQWEVKCIFVGLAWWFAVVRVSIDEVDNRLFQDLISLYYYRRTIAVHWRLKMIPLSVLASRTTPKPLLGSSKCQDVRKEIIALSTAKFGANSILIPI